MCIALDILFLLFLSLGYYYRNCMTAIIIFTHAGFDNLISNVYLDFNSNKYVYRWCIIWQQFHESS